MKYILTADWDDGIADLTARLVKELAASHKVLWLVSGGSNIQASVQIMGNISEEQSRHLTVTLADERYGKPGHGDSNWQQLIAAGFDGKRAKLLPILSGADFVATVKQYDRIITQAFANTDVVIAQLGIGVDGHIAGILPGSPAAQEDTALIAGYQAPSYRRLTITFPALRRVTAAYAFAFGEPKRLALTALQSNKQSLSKLPSQILNELSEAYVYSDQVGEHV
jgi:6-phosphogluconolactonase/glucosamine-6-phosphate isomerase/deaminase